MPSSSVNNTYVIPDDVIICTFISCGLSLIGCMGLLATYIKVSIIRNYIRKLLMFLTLANFIHVCADMTGMFMYVSMRSYNDSTNRYYERFDKMCVTQGLMSSYAPMVEFLWSTVIAVYFHANVLHTSVHQQFATTRGKLISHCCCWIIPAIVCAFGLYYGVFGETRDLFISPGCWIDTDYLSKNDQILWMMLTKIGLECVTFLVVAEVAVFTGWKLLILPIWKPGQGHLKCGDVFKNTSVQAPNRLRCADRNFLWSWLIFYGLRVWGVVRFFKHLTQVEHNTATNLAEEVLMVLQALCDTGQAFVNFMLFCVFNTDVRAHFSRQSERRIMEVVEEEEDGENEERVGMLQK